MHRTALGEMPRKEMAPRKRPTTSTKKSPRTGASKSSPATEAKKSPSTTGANPATTTRAASGNKRPAPTPQWGAKKTKWATRSSKAHATSTHEEDNTPEEEVDNASAEDEPLAPQAPTTPTTTPRYSIITPELIEALCNNPETLQLIISLAMERESTNSPGKHCCQPSIGWQQQQSKNPMQQAGD
jgi:hypothetical protein